MCPLLLTSDPLPPINFLHHEVSLPFPHLPLSLTRCPRLLVSSVPTQLRPALCFITSLGLVRNSHTTLLLVFDVENTLKPKINFLQSLGFDEPEVNRMVVRSPGLLTLSVENNMSPKAEFFLEEMEGTEFCNCTINNHLEIVLAVVDFAVAELRTLVPCHMMVAVFLTQGFSES
ncbi:hypothetical protein J1N35_014656 [Gossypium stocksii]|uniref:Uncharacterized protein n=1 Tax=Gossypium stocksii TaxID=47602 RepID=A0A9D3VUG5_9ROSI|nr:hypothetical protein J1N35_014656 [Gossypium stocksii]